MNQETIEFLTRLQHELNTQDTVGQAHPRFWVIRDYKWQPVPEGYGDRQAIYAFDLHEDRSCTFDEIGELLTDYIEDHDLQATIQPMMNAYGIDNLTHVTDEEILVDILEKLNISYVIHDEEELGYNVSNTLFLTLKEAKKHIKQNQHHYTSKAHPYAMTALRSPEVDTLLTILQTANWHTVAENVAPPDAMPFDTVLNKLYQIENAMNKLTNQHVPQQDLLTITKDVHDLRKTIEKNGIE